MKASIVAAFLVCVFCASVRATDPPVPAGGFLFSKMTLVITHSDFFRSQMDLYQPFAATPVDRWTGILVIHGVGGARDKRVSRLLP